MRKTLLILFLSFLHFIVTVVVFLLSFGSSWTRLAADPPSTFESILNLATAILHFPLVMLLAPLFPDWTSSPLQFLLFIPNSILWGIGLYSLAALVKLNS